MKKKYFSSIVHPSKNPKKGSNGSIFSVVSLMLTDEVGSASSPSLPSRLDGRLSSSASTINSDDDPVAAFLFLISGEDINTIADLTSVRVAVTFSFQGFILMKTQII
jgi:hypothetical protein